MMGESPFCFSRSRTKWEGYEYTCRDCGVTGGAVAAVTHSEECSVEETIEDVHFRADNEDRRPFATSTWRLIQLIVRLTTEAMNGVGESSSGVDAVRERIDGVDGVRWTAQGSSNRIAVGLGRTTPRGELHLEDRRGVVLKVDPNVRFDAEYTPVSANVDELLTWEKAVETDTHEFFAEILTAAPDGMWLAMEQCIPVTLQHRNMDGRDVIHDIEGEEYIYPLRDELKDVGWENPDYKYGNIGVTDDGEAVLIDYGTGPDYDPS